MWVAKIKLRHDCILGNRCKKFNVVLQSYDLNEEKMKSEFETSSFHQISGENENIKKFLVDLKKDKRVRYLEVNENSFYLVESAKEKPVSQFTRKMFFVKPVVIDDKGYEFWEIASYKREELNNFIKKVESLCDEFELESIKNEKLNKIYFPKVLPNLTDLQKQSLELAIRNGYYLIPKKTSLRKLAKSMKISLATFQTHLQKAESKVMPDILAYLK